MNLTKGKSPRIKRMPGFELQPDAIYVGEDIVDVNLNKIKDYFRIAQKQLIKHYNKEGLNLLANVLDKVGNIAFNQFAKQFRGEGIML